MAVGLAATAGIILSAAAAPVRLVGVTSQGDTVLIEATEPVAYSVSRPDAALARRRHAQRERVRRARGCRRARARLPACGWSRPRRPTAARWRACTSLSPSRQSIVVRSARNTIRVELKGAASPSLPVAGADKAAMPAHRQPAADAGRGFADAGGRAAAASGASGQATSRASRGVESGTQAATITRAHQVEQDPGRHDRDARRQRPPRADVRDREQGSPATAGARLSERDVDSAGADRDRQPARDARARRGQQPSAARHARRHGDRRSASYHVERSRRGRPRPGGRVRAGEPREHGRC